MKFVRRFIYVCVSPFIFYFFIFFIVKAYEFGLLDFVEIGCNPYR